MRLYIVEHYETMAPSPAVAETHIIHMATHVLPEEMQDERFIRGTFLGTFLSLSPANGTFVVLKLPELILRIDDPDDEISVVHTAEQPYFLEEKTV